MSGFLRIPGVSLCLLVSAASTTSALAGEAKSCAFDFQYPDSNLTITRDVEYARMGSERLALDIVIPRGKVAAGTVMLVHGGSWVSGSKGDMMNHAKALASLGYASVSVDYRLTEFNLPFGNKFPAPVQDVRCAVRWLRENGASYGLNTDRLVAYGVSAGGHLVSMLGTTAKVSGLDSLDCPIRPSKQSSAVQLVVSVAGPQDFTADEHLDFLHRYLVRLFLGGMPVHNPSWARFASPAHHVDADTVPFLLVHGTEDGEVPVSQSRVMNQVLSAAGKDVRYLEYPGAGHELVGEPPICEIDAFLKAHAF